MAKDLENAKADIALAIDEIDALQTQLDTANQAVKTAFAAADDIKKQIDKKREDLQKLMDKYNLLPEA